MSVTTGARRSAFSFSNHAGMLSRPDAFAGFEDASFRKTHVSEMGGWSE